MKIEEYANNILSAWSRCDDINRGEYIRENAESILDALKWISAESKPERHGMYMAKRKNGIEEKTCFDNQAKRGTDPWFDPFGDHEGNPVVEWRELI